VYGDTAVIRALARDLRIRAADIRAEADALAGRAEAVPWDGLAADGMRRLARDHATVLRCCASAHDDAADALDRHAREVDYLKDLIAAIEGRARGLLRSASGLPGLLGDLVPDALDRWAHDFVPPSHGSRSWLDVDLPVPG
jgi:hypothetical protein